ncbi:transposase [Caloramator mitchellensis]|uniref:transposase n=1 Tax=Caloramator mitchellensis TaxID=908809 RepID=UPI003BFA6BAC
MLFYHSHFYPLRGTEAWNTLYNERTSAERFFGDGKENYALNNIRAAGLDKAKVFIDIACISILTTRIAEAKQLKKISA